MAEAILVLFVCLFVCLWLERIVILSLSPSSVMGKSVLILEKKKIKRKKCLVLTVPSQMLNKCSLLNWYVYIYIDRSGILLFIVMTCVTLKKKKKRLPLLSSDLWLNTVMQHLVCCLWLLLIL